MLSNIEGIVRDLVTAAFNQQDRLKLANRFFKRDPKDRVKLVILIKNDKRFAEL